ncbi:MAG: hypothetical protein U5R06_05275 [candidate division KSB1 bacterium]|nr:hypothetical protein [candidate division KSB1 bacterium]
MKRIQKNILRGLAAVPLVLLAIFFIFTLFLNQSNRHPINKGNIEIPDKRTYVPRPNSALQQQLFHYWTDFDLFEWQDGEKVDVKVPRIVLSNLLLGIRIDEINQYLMRQQATGVSGSRWLLNPKGGYNFNTAGFTPLLYLFDEKPDRLYPQTRKHLIDHILTIKGNGFSRNVPFTWIQDSENHILMTGSSRYLVNQWMWNHGYKQREYNNKENGVKKGLVNYLREIKECGFYEYNSDPYLGYTFCALLNLEAFASGEVQKLARKLLDLANWYYALGSFKFKHFPPYRRLFRTDFRTGLKVDYHTAMMKVWTSFYTDTLDLQIERGQHHALWAAMLPYRPPDKVIDWTLSKPLPYFVKIGHGTNSCPEIYSGDPHYLLSAGGANQGKRSLIVAKPITLLLDDNAKTLEQTFHMSGPGQQMLDWNNTGVYKRFACTAGPVQVPNAYHPVETDENWSIYRIAANRLLAVYSQTGFGHFLHPSWKRCTKAAECPQFSQSGKKAIIH